MSLGGGSSKTAQQTEPWKEQIPYLTDAFKEAGRLYWGGGSPYQSIPSTASPSVVAGGTAGTVPNFYPGASRINAAATQTQPASGAPALPNTGTAGTGGIVPAYYPGSTVAGRSAATYGGMDIVKDLAYGGTPTLDNALGTVTSIMGGGSPNNPYNLSMNTASGAFLGGNPYMDAMYGKAARGVSDQFLNEIFPQLSGGFAAGGRYNSGSRERAEGRAAGILGTSLADLATSMYGQDYANERGLMEQAQGRAGQLRSEDENRRLTAAGLAPGLEEARYLPAEQLLNIGAMNDEYMQRNLDADIARWDYEQAMPLQALINYLGLVQGNYGQTSTGKQSNMNFKIPLFGS